MRLRVGLDKGVGLGLGFGNRRSKAQPLLAILDISHKMHM